MRSSIPFCTLFVAGALGSPLRLFNRLHVREIVTEVVTEEVVVTDVVTVTIFGPPVTLTTASSTSTIAKVHQVSMSSGAFRHWHHTRHSVISTPAATPTASNSSSPSTSATVLPTSISTSTFVPSSTFIPGSTSIPMSIYTPFPSPISSSSSSEVEPVPTSSEVVVVPTSSQVVIMPTSTSSAAAASSTPAPSDSSPMSGGVSLLTTVNKYRTLYSLPTLSWSSTLHGNALKTGTDDLGVNENHELNPGSFGQVIAPGMSTAMVDLGGDTPFEISFAAWLCEVSSDPELSAGGVNQCDLVEKVLHITQKGTGHHDILTSKSYTQIGCAFAPNAGADPTSVYQGLWICDVAF